MLAKTKMGELATPIARHDRLSTGAVVVLIAGANTALWTGILAMVCWAL